ncbi:MAG: hypothetical protein IPK17_21845 [Chloroflexi bacterium]|uniref:hypothetical protein n=1 Tax=Candidatus Flexifilum breve TaxID=3140694 RepID=UPI0031360323|nr:hypothetical protein [Chloroflexota bacterium]
MNCPPTWTCGHPAEAFGRRRAPTAVGYLLTAFEQRDERPNAQLLEQMQRIARRIRFDHIGGRSDDFQEFPAG